MEEEGKEVWNTFSDTSDNGGGSGGGGCSLLNDERFINYYKDASHHYTIPHRTTPHHTTLHYTLHCHSLIYVN